MAKGRTSKILITLIGLVLTAGPSSGDTALLIPGTLSNDTGKILSDVAQLEGGAIYRYSPGRPPQMLIHRPLGTLSSPELSPSGDRMAYNYRVMTASGIAGVGPKVVPWIIITSSDGTPVDSVRGGTAFSWSPDGGHLVTLRENLSVRWDPTPDTLVVWRGTKEPTRHYLLPALQGSDLLRGGRCWDVAWISPDTVLASYTGLKDSRWLAIESGAIGPTNHRTPNLSQDGSYYVEYLGWTSDGPRPTDAWPFRVVDHTAGVEVTTGVVQQIQRPTLERIGRARWIKSRNQPHTLAVATTDTTIATELRRQSRVHFIDVGSLRSIYSIPGMLLGVSDGGSQIVIARGDKVEFVSIHDLERQWRQTRSSRDKASEGSVDVELLMGTWGKFHERDTLEFKTVRVRSGEWLGPKGDPTGRDSDRAPFRILSIREDNRAIGESVPGLIPQWNQPDNTLRLKHRFVLSNEPLSFGTPTFDYGTWVRLRTVSPRRN